MRDRVTSYSKSVSTTEAPVDCHIPTGNAKALGETDHKHNDIHVSTIKLIPSQSKLAQLQSGRNVAQGYTSEKSVTHLHVEFSRMISVMKRIIHSHEKE